MSAADYICKITDVAYPRQMGKWKYDHIQVVPWKRYLFKNRKAMLYFEEHPILIDYCGDGPHPLLSFHWGHYSVYFPRFWRGCYWQWRKYGRFYTIPTMTWEYCLYVPGDSDNNTDKVSGEYWNMTHNPEKVVRNMEKLTGRLCVCSVPWIFEQGGLPQKMKFEAFQDAKSRFDQEIE